MTTLKAGKKIQIINSDDIQDDDWIICPYLMGTSGPETEAVKNQKAMFGVTTKKITNMPLTATELLLSQNTSVQLSAVIPYEIGAAATASAVATAAWLGVSVIDADFVGRAVPEASQMLPAIDDVDLCPTACADAYGNVTVIQKSINRQMFERIGKYIASASFGLIGQAALLRPKQQLKKYMLTGTLSKALLVGKAFRAHQENNIELEQLLLETANSKKIFEGIISSFNGEDIEGYYVGTIMITNQNDCLKIWFKNENHMAWLNDKVCATSPDLISLVCKETKKPVVNNQLKVGMKMTVFATPCHPKWREEQNLKVNSPAYYGF